MHSNFICLESKCWEVFLFNDDLGSLLSILLVFPFILGAFLVFSFVFMFSLVIAFMLSGLSRLSGLSFFVFMSRLNWSFTESKQLKVRVIETNFDLLCFVSLDGWPVEILLILLGLEHCQLFLFDPLCGYFCLFGWLLLLEGVVNLNAFAFVILFQCDSLWFDRFLFLLSSRFFLSFFDIFIGFQIVFVVSNAAFASSFLSWLISKHNELKHTFCLFHFVDHVCALPQYLWISGELSYSRWLCGRLWPFLEVSVRQQERERSLLAFWPLAPFCSSSFLGESFWRGVPLLFGIPLIISRLPLSAMRMDCSYKSLQIN